MRDREHRPVSGGDDDDTFLGIESVHFDEKGIEGLFALVVAAADAVARWRPTASISSMKIMQGADFCPAQTCRDPAGADADKHLDEIGTADGEEWDISSPAMARASKVLPVPGGPTRSTPLGMRPPSF